MYSDFKGKAIEFVKLAVAEDEAGNLEKVTLGYDWGRGEGGALSGGRHRPSDRQGPRCGPASATTTARPPSERLARNPSLPRPAPRRASGRACSRLCAASPRPARALRPRAPATAAAPGQALQYYKAALEYFQTHLKYEKNQRSREAIVAKVKEYLSRAEYLKEASGWGHGVAGWGAVGAGLRWDCARAGRWGGAGMGCGVGHGWGWVEAGMALGRGGLGAAWVFKYARIGGSPSGGAPEP
jgi:hypothetical protein